MSYKHIFFDLDNTLWDFKANCIESLDDILLSNNLLVKLNSVNKFYTVYNKYNEQLWLKYRKGKITKDKLRTVRFQLALSDFGIKDEKLAAKINDEYMQMCPLKTNVLPHTDEILSYLAEKYRLHIITNGFTETQNLKIKKCKLDKYFDKVFTSETINASKPNKEIFHYALSSLNAKKNESIMIGDNLEVDIIGAKKYGIDQVYLNLDDLKHNEKITYEIESLIELKEIL